VSFTTIGLDTETRDDVGAERYGEAPRDPTHRGGQFTAMNSFTVGMSQGGHHAGTRGGGRGKATLFEYPGARNVPRVRKNEHPSPVMNPAERLGPPRQRNHGPVTSRVAAGYSEPGVRGGSGYHRRGAHRFMLPGVPWAPRSCAFPSLGGRHRWARGAGPGAIGEEPEVPDSDGDGRAASGRTTRRIG
jgi:hypothetical protein